MADYRFCLLNSDDKIDGAHDMACEPDDEACEAARHLPAGDRKAEVWVAKGRQGLGSTTPASGMTCSQPGSGSVHVQ